MTSTRRPTPADRLLITGLFRGGWLASACQTLVTLGVVEELGEQTRSAHDLATATGLRAGALYRVLRALTSVDVLAEPEPGEFALTPAGSLLLADVPGSLMRTALAGAEVGDNLFADLGEVLTTGIPASERLPAGRRERASELHDQLSSATPVPSAIGLCTVTGSPVVADLGTGALGEHVLRGCPGATLAAPAGIGEIPAADLYLLPRLLHALPDEGAVELLGRVRAAARPAARLLVFEKVLPDTPVFHPAKVDDLLTLVLLPGRERSEHELRALLDAAGIDTETIRSNAVDLDAESVLEARPR